MAWLYHFNQIVTHGMEGFLETAVPMISGLAEIIGLFIIVTSLSRPPTHMRATFSMASTISSTRCPAPDHGAGVPDVAEIAKTFLLQNLESVVPLAATFALRAMMSLMLHWEMEAGTAPAAKRKKRPPVRPRKKNDL